MTLPWRSTELVLKQRPFQDNGRKQVYRQPLSQAGSAERTGDVAIFQQLSFVIHGRLPSPVNGLEQWRIVLYGLPFPEEADLILAFLATQHMSLTALTA
jgi:hypothetical protein